MTDLAIDRFRDALYTPSEAARYLNVPLRTVRRWAWGDREVSGEGRDAMRPGVVTALRDRPTGHASIPFVGLAEAYTLRALRDAGVSLQRIRPALAKLEARFGLEHSLASQHLYTDGLEVLYDFASEADDGKGPSAELVVVRHGQQVFTQIVAGYLERVAYVSGYAQAFPLPGYQHGIVMVDAARGFGQPIFARSGARVQDALDLFKAGESLRTVAEEYDVPEHELEEALRVAVDRAA
jgi:uncharacterized protein (DUF433 family)/DNA-binding transcriptional MerR regulator